MGVRSQKLYLVYQLSLFLNWEAQLMVTTWFDYCNYIRLTLKTICKLQLAQNILASSVISMSCTGCTEYSCSGILCSSEFPGQGDSYINVLILPFQTCFEIKQDCYSLCHFLSLKKDEVELHFYNITSRLYGEAASFSLSSCLAGRPISWEINRTIFIKRERL